MTTGFLLINAIFFGVLFLIFFPVWLFSRHTTIYDRTFLVVVLLFIWSAYCITQVVGI